MAQKPWFEKRQKRTEDPTLTAEGNWALSPLGMPEFVDRDGRRILTARAVIVIQDAWKTLSDQGEGL